jgi:hypothetical protein
MAALGRQPSYALALGHGPLSGAKQPFKKHHFSGYESQLSARSGWSGIHTLAQTLVCVYPVQEKRPLILHRIKNNCLTHKKSAA